MNVVNDNSMCSSKIEKQADYLTGSYFLLIATFLVNLIHSFSNWQQVNDNKKCHSRPSLKKVRSYDSMELVPLVTG